jgi:hypothetical protein
MRPLRSRQEEKQMAKDEKDGIDRRGALECMIWAGTGVMAAGALRSSLLGISEVNARAASGITFLQISDSHIHFKRKLIKDVVDGVSNVAQVAAAVSLGSQSSANLDRAKLTLYEALDRAIPHDDSEPAECGSHSLIP